MRSRVQILPVVFGLLLVLCAALANPIQLTLIGNTERLILLGSGPIRYEYRAAENLIFLPEASLANGTRLPDGITAEQKDEGLYLRLSQPVAVVLSPDGLRLSISRSVASTVATDLPPPPAPSPQVMTPDVSPPAPPAPQAEPPKSEPPSTNAAQQASALDERLPRIYYLSYAAPNSVAALLLEFYTNVRVKVDERRHALLIVVNAGDWPVIEQFIKLLDTPSPQVLFEAEVLEVNRNLTQSLGIDYDRILSFKFNEGTPPANALSFAPFGRTALNFSIGINLLQTSGAARVLAKPRIATLDGNEARINATQTYPLVVTGTNNSAPIVQNITTGITMRMLPRVAPTGEIEVQLAITVSTPTGVTSSGAPQYSSREASTVVRVKSGEPFAIGGLIENRKIESVDKVPFLGDIPILGELFKKTTTDLRETDLVIIVTPRILTGNEPAPTEPKLDEPKP